MMPPPPEVVNLNEEATLLAEPEDESVATGREAFALLYQELASLATEVQFQHSNSRSTRTRFSHTHLKVSSKVPAESLLLGQLAEAAVTKECPT